MGCDSATVHAGCHDFVVPSALTVNRSSRLDILHTFLRRAPSGRKVDSCQQGRLSEQHHEDDRDASFIEAHLGSEPLDTIGSVLPRRGSGLTAAGAVHAGERSTLDLTPNRD